MAVNLLSIAFYTQSAPDGVENAIYAVDKTESWVYLAQRVLGGFIIFHGVVIFLFDSYREFPVVKTLAGEKGIWPAIHYTFTEKVNVLYYLVYISIAMLGMYYPAWFAFLMNDILNINQVLKNIVKSVWRPRSSIALTLIFFIIIMYAFSSVGFVLFSEYYTNSMPNQIPCKNIFQCFLLTIDKGMKFDGGIGNYLANHNENKSETGEYIPVSLGRFAFENLFLLIDFIIVLSIVTGIIIDTFGSLREEYNAYIEDTESFCFICGHDRETLDKESEEKEGFEHHVKNEHYQWNYLFYIGYLKDKEATELTGLESYIAGLIAKEKIDWFPSHRAMMIKEDGGMEADEALDDNLENIEKNVGKRDPATKLRQADPLFEEKSSGVPELARLQEERLSCRVAQTPCQTERLRVNSVSLWATVVDSKVWPLRADYGHSASGKNQVN